MATTFKMNDANKKILKQCRAKSPTCFDCGAQNPAWASIHFGILVCFDCAGSHRQMGTHISFVRSTAFDGWKEEHIKKMIVGGNQRAAVYFRKYGSNPRKKTQSFAQYYDSKVARRYKDQLTDDAKNHVLETPVSPKASPNTGGAGQLDKLISGLKLQSTGANPPAPIARTVPIVKSSPRQPTEAKAKVVTNVVKKNSKKSKPKVVKKAQSKKKKPAKSMKLGGGKKKTGFLVEDDSTDFDASSDEDTGQKQAQDDEFGQKPKQKPKTAAPPKPSTSGNEVRRVFAQKYGTKVRGGEKKMTSIGSDDFFNNSPEEVQRKTQFTDARAIGSDAYFGRGETVEAGTSGPPKNEIDWDDIRGEASAKVERISEAAGDWFASLTSKLSSGR